MDAQDNEKLAEKAFNAYNEAATPPWTTFDGRPVPRWPQLGAEVQKRWKAAALAVALALGLSGCATFRAPPPATPTACQAWSAAATAWSLAEAYAHAQLEQQRAAACMPPPLVPESPAEPTPRAPTAPPEQVPLPGMVRREE